MKRSGVADLPLHGGRVPNWLAERMVRLGTAIGECIVYHYGTSEFLSRLSDPYCAKTIAEDVGCVHVDIRSPNAGKMTIAERDTAMVEHILKAAGAATSVLVIVGEEHRTGVSNILRETSGWGVQSEQFPASLPEESHVKGPPGMPSGTRV